MIHEVVGQEHNSGRQLRTRRLRGVAAGGLSIVAAFLFVCLPLFSQINTGRILGIITDQSGSVIVGATVTIKDVQRGITRTFTTDSSGQYVVPSLLPGTYLARATAKGFKTVQYSNILVEVGKDYRADITLPPGEVEQTVTVTGAAPLVDTTSATLGGTLSNTAINNLPLNGGNFQYLITLRPGVMIQPGGSAWTQSTNGLRAGETIYYVDGMMDNDYSVGWTVVNAPSPITEASTVLPTDAIQEFNLEQNPKAEYGWKPGEVINVGVKSGTNRLHGTAFAFGRDGAWDARNYFNTSPAPQLPLTMETFGGTVGGPIIKDKLFYFAGYEGRRDTIGNAFSLGVPETVSQATEANPAGDPANSIPDAEAALTAASVPISPATLKLLTLFPANPTSSPTQVLGFPNTDRTDNVVLKLNYSINSHNTLAAMLFIGDYFGIGEDRAYVNPIFDTDLPGRSVTGNYSWIWTPNSRWVNEVRFGFNRMYQALINGDIGVPASSYGLNTGITSPGGLPAINIGASYELGTSFTRPDYNGPSPLYDGADNVSYVRGRHTLKFGYEMSHIRSDEGGFALARGWINFFGGGTPQIENSTALEDFLAGNSTFALHLEGNVERHLNSWAFMPFIQDDWRVTKRLTFNLGLRYEYFTPPSESNGLIGNFCPNLPNNLGVTSCPTLGLEQVGKQISSIFEPDRKNFSPRFGISWDPTGNGTTAIRAGGGLMYDHPFLGEWDNQLAEQNGPFTGIGTIPTGFLLNGTPGPGKINSGSVVSFPSAGTGPGQWDGVVFPPAVLQCTTDSPCGFMGVVPNWKTPYVINWNLGVQHSFTGSLALDVEYVGNHGKEMPTITNVNQPVNGVAPYAAEFPYLGAIDMMSNIGFSNYNGLQVTLTEHNLHGLDFQAGYTYSHALDVSSLDAFALMPQDSLNPTADYASSDFDLRHRFTLSLTYAIPGHEAPLQLLKGWSINSIVTLETGQPWTIDDTTDNISGTGDLTDRWDFFGNPADFKVGPEGIPFCSGPETCFTYQPVTDIPIAMSTADASTAWTQCAAHAPDPTTLAAHGCYIKGHSVLVPPTAGTFGTMGRNLFPGPGLYDWDGSIFKTIKFTEQFKGEFHAEFFNILNHPAFANPYGGPNGYGSTGPWNPAAPGLFGGGLSTPDVATGNPILGSGDSRLVQLGLKLMF